MKISHTTFYAGARDKLCRLGLAKPFVDLQELILDTKIQLPLKRKATNNNFVNRRLNRRLVASGDWRRNASPGVRRVRHIRYKDIFLARLGVEVQVSARSDLLIRDIVHLRNSLQEGVIDIGVIVVPDDEMQVFLTDRTPSYRDAVRYIEKEFKEATTFPIIIMAIGHDGISDKPLPKKKTNLGEAVSEIRLARRSRRKT